MKPPNHKYLFYTSSNKLLFSSLQRYFKYILSLELHQLKETSLSPSTTLLIYYKEKENSELLNILSNNKNIKIILLGLDNSCTVNLLDFVNLKSNFKLKLSENSYSATSLFTEAELKEKLKSFFHSHGENSIFEYLNWTIYYFREGYSQFIAENISYQDYKEKFIQIGAKNWNKFKVKYENFKNLFKIYKLQLISEEVENNMKNVDRCISEICKMSEKELFNQNPGYYLELIEKLEKINYIFDEIFRNLNIERKCF